MFDIRPLTEEDRGWVAELLESEWGSTRIVTRGVVCRADELPGFAAFDQRIPIGLATYCIGGADEAGRAHRPADKGPECELVSLNSLTERAGVGSALLEAVADRARELRCRRLWLITTNDNLHAIRFYQRRGLQLAALHRNAIEVSRQLKPDIPLIGMDGIPVRDEIELELEL